MLPSKLAIVDTETTGFRATSDRIIEIGIIRIEDGVVVQKFQTLLNPECYLPQDIEYLTGIRKNDLLLAPTFHEIKDQILELLQDCVFVAHNVRFDYSFLKNEFKREGVKFNPKQICSVKLSRYFFPKHTRHGLDAIIERFNISCLNRHRALDDAWVVWEFYQHLQKTFTAEKIEAAIASFFKKPTIPVGLCAEDLKDLPQSPGVYIFYGDENIPLYIGKSVNLSDRIHSHFSSDHSSPLEMKISQQVKRIKIVQTPGELGALLTEAKLIKQLCPLYNRKLRYTRKLLCLVKKETKDGYASISLENIESFTSEVLQNIMAFAKSKKQAKDFLSALAKEFDLCEKLLGVESTLTECFGYRLGKCKGACKNKEKPIAYNFRFLQAFVKTKIRPWPFTGPILITEKNEEQETVQSFMIDNWCFLGTGETMDQFQEEVLAGEIPFDLDTYKIINSFIAKKENLRKIKILKKPITSSPLFINY